MNQYLSVKREYPDAILLFRLGDFYEMFYEDAKVASEILGIALTSRDRSKKNPVPLCGVPYHSVEPHISKLLGSGKKVAICEQVGDPKQAKGIVERRVVRVLTPGAVLDSENLESKNNNYLACVAQMTGMVFALCFCDISTGEFQNLFFPLAPGSSLRACAHRPEGDTHLGFWRGTSLAQVPARRESPYACNQNRFLEM